tara:strand:- start:2546 stop:3313 length:768 start_codon:yes stop_codon:yes gene_type:complete
MPDLINENGTWVLQEDANFSDLKINTIDLTDGTWTNVDINSNINTLSFANDANKIVTNAVSAGNINLLNKSDYNAARWYKTLTYEDGTQVLTTDQFIFISTLQGLSSSNPSPFGFACGLSLHPLATGSNSQTNQAFNGHSLFNETSNSTTGFKHEYSSATQAGGGSIILNVLTSSLCTCVINWGAPTGTQKGNISVTRNNRNVVTQRSTMTMSSSADLPLYLQVCFATRYNTNECLAGAEHKQIMKYKVIRILPE